MSDGKNNDKIHISIWYVSNVFCFLRLLYYRSLDILSDPIVDKKLRNIQGF